LSDVRALVAFLSVVTLAVAWPASGSGPPSGAGVRFDCGVRRVDLYFWPRGHPKVRRLHPPPYDEPHLDVFRQGRIGLPGMLANVVSGGISFMKQCHEVADLATSWEGGPATKVTRPRRVRCGFSRPVELRGAPRVSGRTLDETLTVTLGHTKRAVVVVVLGPRGFRIAYDGRYCTAASA
jgi:hypothetical protein